MASTTEIFQEIHTNPPPSPHGIMYNYLVPNIRGMENMVRLLSGASESSKTNMNSGYPTPPPSPQAENAPTSTQNTNEVSLFAAATEAFSRANTNCSIAESLERCKPIVALAKEHNLRPRGYVSVALGCPYEGPNVDPHVVAEMTASLLEMGCDEVSIADTTGMGTVPRTRKLLEVLQAAGIRMEDIALHFHDTYGQALVNTIVGLEKGVRVFDSSVGGLGGCPYSKGATGNVSTEDLVHMLHSLGIETGIDLGKMSEIGGWISGELNRKNDSRAGKATLSRMTEE